MNPDMKLIADSSASLPHSAVERYDICVLPFYAAFGTEPYHREDPAGSTDPFYRHMEMEPQNLPRTAAPNICDWCDLLEAQIALGRRQFLLMTISSALSGSYQNACAARQQVLEAHPEVQIEAMDSCTCACGLAALEIAAARLIDARKPYEEVVETVRAMRPAAVSLFSVRDLTYMRAGGRIGGAAAFIGKLAGIKPVCDFVGGVVKPVGAVPGRKRSIQYMVDRAIAQMGDPKGQIISVQNALFPEDVVLLQEYFRRRTGFAGEIYHSDLGIVVGSHSGPGAIGIGFVRDPL